MATSIVEIRVRVGDQAVTHRYESSSGNPDELEDVAPEVLVVAARSAKGVLQENFDGDITTPDVHA